MREQLKAPILTVLLTISFVVSFSASSNGQDTREKVRETGMSVDPFEQNQKLGKGVNLGNALEAPSEGEWGMVVQEEYLQLISEAGFDAVRIPVRWNAHASSQEPFTIEPSFFERMDKVISWALERDLMVVLNIHHYNELMENPEEHRDRFLSIWEQIARHYHDAPSDLLFEVLNEPHGELIAERWNEYLRSAIDVIRASNLNRTLVIGTAPWGGIDGLTDLSLPEENRNIIVTVHYYNPFQFTHQGASWAGDEANDWLGTTWTATEAQVKAVNDDFDMVQQWAQEHNRPIYLGEFGAYSAAPQQSREIWTDYIRSAAEQRNFSWGYWEFGAGFGIYDRDNNQWRSGLLNALIPGSPVLK